MQDRIKSKQDKNIAKGHKKLNSITELPFSKLGSNYSLMKTLSLSMKPLFIKTIDH